MFARYFLKALALPPVLNILLIFVALGFLGRWRSVQLFILWFSSVSLLILSLPAATPFLARALHLQPPLDADALDTRGYDAIVVLGAGRHDKAAEYGGDIPSSLGLERLRYAAYLQKKTGLPLLVTGGRFAIDQPPESEFMKRVLEQEFSVPVRWEEEQSRTTWENAQYSKQIALSEDINSVLLVTHAWHMPRALYSFQQAGFRVTGAPTIFGSMQHPPRSWFDMIPQASALASNALILHELLGLQWYKWVYA